MAAPFRDTRVAALIAGTFLVTSSGLAEQSFSQTGCDAPASASLRKDGLAAAAQHRYETAVKDLQSALAACPMEGNILLDLSEAHARARDFTSAIRDANEFLRLKPDSIWGRLVLANAYFMAQRFAEAGAECDGVLKSDPGEPTALKLKGNIQYLTGDFDHAETTFIDLLEGHPEDEEAPYMLGRIYYSQGRITHAIGQFERVLKLNPRSYKAYDNLGLCYQALGETEKAIGSFLTAIKLVETAEPDYDWPYANLAELLLDKNEFDQAFSAAAKAADRNPYRARNFYLGGKALCKLQKTDLCVNWLQRSIALDPDYPQPLYLLSKAYSELGQKEKARETLTKFLAVNARTSGTRR